MHLDHVAASILYLLWKRQRSDDASFFTAEVLLSELQEGKATAQFRTGLQVPAVKATLRDLRAAKMVESGVSEKRESRPGPAPTGYRLSWDPPLITKRTIAAIVRFLHHHRDRPLRRDILIEEAFALGLTHHDQSEPLTRQEISDFVDWSIRKGYIIDVVVTIDETPPPVTEKRLITTSKVDECELFLQKIAGEVRRQVASETHS